MSKTFDFTIEELGKRSVKSPIVMSKTSGGSRRVPDTEFP